MPPPHDMLAARRGSLAAVSDAPSSPRDFSPSGQHPNQRGYQNQNQQWNRVSPVVSHPSPQSVPGQPILPGLAAADNQAQTQEQFEKEIEEQKLIMRQTRELAIKRRQEQEAKEEAAKQERIRLKLEAMGPAPDKKKDKKEISKEDKAVPTQIQSRIVNEVIPPKVGPSGELEAKKSKTELQNPSAEGKLTDRLPNIDTRPNGLHKGRASMAGQQDNSSWQNNAGATGDRSQPWVPPAAQQSSTRNVWGPPPSNDRPLGNGTFNPELSRLPDSQPFSSRPGPIGPPRGDASYQQGRRPAPIGPPPRQSAASDEQKQRVAAAGWSNLGEKLAREEAEARKQQEIELAHRRELEAQGLLPEEPQPVYKDTWRKVTLNEDGTRSKVHQSTTNKYDSAGQWKSIEENTRTVFDERRPLNAERYDQPQPYFNDAWKAPGVGPSPLVRGSRFFPNNNKDVRLEDSNEYSFDRPGSPSPPPPTTAEHPAYDGDTVHPHVSLPRPPPVVKLPPMLAPIAPPKPASFAAAVSAPAPASQSTPQGRHTQDVRNESSQSHNWQDRISSLLGRKNSPPKHNSFAVDSSSKYALELPTSQPLATVSLPSSVSGDLVPDNGSVISKPAAEECFEEQEMGSLPTIKFPAQAPPNLWQPVAISKVRPAQDKEMGRLAWVSAEAYTFEKTFTETIEAKNRRPAINILLPGQTIKAIVEFKHQKRNGHKPYRGNAGTPRSASSTHRGRGGRDPSSTHPSSGVDSASASSSNTRGGHRGGRGGNRGNSGSGRGYDWPRHPAPIQG